MLESTGKIDFRVGGETFQTWYKVVGDLKSGLRPLVTLHGGPGVSHSYMTPHADLLASHGIPIILYDQVGIGESTHLPDKPTEFWTIDLFMDELDNLLAHFNIEDNFDLLGHSWGGMLGSTYAALRQPQGLRHLVITNSPASMALWEECTTRLLQGFPQELTDMLKRHEGQGTTSSKEYQDGMMLFYQRHVCRVMPWPDDLNKAFEIMGADPTVYHTMQGPSEFAVTGTLKDWTIIDELHNIKCPTLVMNSVYDEAQDLCVLPFFKRIPKVKWVQYANSSHMPFFEERKRYIQVVGDFLTTI